jgi:hypothetical protein
MKESQRRKHPDQKRIHSLVQDITTANADSPSDEEAKPDFCPGDK